MYNFARDNKGIFVVRRNFPDWSILQEGSERPGMAGEENSSMAGSGFFPEFPPREWGGEEGSCLVLQKLPSTDEGNQYAHLEP